MRSRVLFPARLKVEVSRGEEQGSGCKSRAAAQL